MSDEIVLRQKPPDDLAECTALVWVAIEAHAARLFEELDRRDIWEPRRRELWLRLKTLHEHGPIRSHYEIRGWDIVRVWDDLTPRDSDELARLYVETPVPMCTFGPGGVGGTGDHVVNRLKGLTRDRLLLAAAEAVGRGEQVADGIVRFVLEGRV